MTKIDKLAVTYVDIDDIQPNSYNPNRQSDKDFELLCRSIEEDGFTQPILVQESTKEIVDGEHRWRAMRILSEKDAKWRRIPVVFTEMSKEQMMVSTLRHNRARGSENIAMAADVLKEINDLGALDHAADSLMMDEIEIQIMLEDIPSAELNLRKPNMTEEDVLDMLDQEKNLEQKKREEDSRQYNTEIVLTLALRVTLDEHAKLLSVIEAITGDKKKTAEGLLVLCRTYKDKI